MKAAEWLLAEAWWVAEWLLAEARWAAEDLRVAVASDGKPPAVVWPFPWEVPW